MRVITAVLIVFGTMATISSPLGGQGPDPTNRIQELIDQLGSTTFVEREKATRELEAIGATALPALRKSLKSAGAVESRRRIEILVRTIERRELAAKVLAPTRIRLKVKNANVPDAVREFAKGSGIPIHLSDEAAANAWLVTLDTGETSYWDAYARLCQVGRLVEENSLMGPFDVTQALSREFPSKILDTAPGIHLTLGKPLDVPTVIFGSVRIRLIRVAAAPNGAVDLVLEVTGEPRLSGLEPAGEVYAKIIDDVGRTLTQIPTADEPLTRSQHVVSKLLAHRAGNWATMLADGAILTERTFGSAPPVGHGPFRVVARIQQGDKKSRAIKELTVRLPLQTNAETEPIVIENILKAVGCSGVSFDGAKLTVQAVEEMANKDVRIEVVWEKEVLARGLGIQASISGKSGNGKAKMVMARNIEMTNGDERRTTTLAGAPRLLDADGNAFKLVEWTSHKWTITVGKMAHRATLVYRPGPGQNVPASLSLAGQQAFAFDVSVTFRDIPLP